MALTLLILFRCIVGVFLCRAASVNIAAQRGFRPYRQWRTSPGHGLFLQPEECQQAIYLPVHKPPFYKNSDRYSVARCHHAQIHRISSRLKHGILKSDSSTISFTDKSRNSKA